MTRIKARKASDAIDRIAKQAQRLFSEENAEAALDLVNEGLETDPHVRLWRLKARLLVFFGREDEATKILHRVLPQAWGLGFWELSQSGLGASHALLSKAHKVAYFPIPKCSSTSLHNVMAILNGKDQRGEEVHKNLRQYDIVQRSLPQKDLKAYEKILIVRSPLDRIRSFYFGNVWKREHLVRDRKGSDSFYGLHTKPSYDAFLDQFEAYRRTFLTARHHTNPLTSFVGTDASYFDWIGGVQDTANLIDHLREITGVRLPKIHDMRALAGKENQPMSAKEQALMHRYKGDFDAFSSWF